MIWYFQGRTDSAKFSDQQRHLPAVGYNKDEPHLHQVQVLGAGAAEWPGETVQEPALLYPLSHGTHHQLW